MKSSEHRYKKAHSYIQEKRLDESYAIFKTLSIILFLLFTTSAFIVQKNFYNDSRFGSMETQSQKLEKLDNKAIISLKDFEDEFSSFNQSNVIDKELENISYSKSENNSEEAWGFSLDHQTEVVQDLGAVSEKPVISAKIAILIQATNSESIDIEAFYTVVG